MVVPPAVAALGLRSGEVVFPGIDALSCVVVSRADRTNLHNGQARFRHVAKPLALEATCRLLDIFSYPVRAVPAEIHLLW